MIVIDEQKLHTLNEVGTFVWSSAGPDGRAIEAIVDAVVQEFEVDADTATRDVVGFAKQLLQLGAFEVKEAS
ncbi:MAG TPA: PqqD family protein [Sandaracinaceae bacterium LLY-WYZ-13_1]|nr:PqqD family protein [Sandaracinaceae bacterium LLY-WYZ-13_1]